MSDVWENPSPTDTWMGRDGTVYEIGQMTDDHVLNAERWCRRQIATGNEAVSGAYAYSPQGEMASYYVDRSIDQMEDQLLDMGYCHARMVAEVRQRGLVPLA
jgi:hypothetical protein